jgi:hypothetical protein
MKGFLLAAWLLAASASGICAELRTPDRKPEKPPAERDQRPPSPPQEDMSSGTGIVIEPPVTDTESLKKPPENVDPEIDQATEDIEDKKRKELQEKAPSR